MWFQTTISLKPRTRGFHLITAEIESAIQKPLNGYTHGICQLFLLHTSASLSINENADRSVRTDLETHYNRLAPDGAAHYTHTLEGPDDMAAHIKASLLGASLTVPISQGRLLLGTWQGIYLCEHRDHGGGRKLVITLHGE